MRHVRRVGLTVLLQQDVFFAKKDLPGGIRCDTRLGENAATMWFDAAPSLLSHQALVLELRRFVGSRLSPRYQPNRRVVSWKTHWPSHPKVSRRVSR